MMETEENGEEEESSFISSSNFIKLKIINFKLLPSTFREQEPSKFKFLTSLKRILQYSNLYNITRYKFLYALLGGC